jgi:ADP-ribose pyrophosphatase YjhB (NUDIX family)
VDLLMERFKLVPESHLFLVQKDRILLLRRSGTDYEDGKYSVVAGHMDGAETAREAICREAREEAGIELAPEDLAFAQVVHRADRGERVSFFFAAERWQGEVRNMEPHKASEMGWFPLDALPDPMVPYVRQAIERWRAGVPYGESGWPPRDK